MLLALAITLCAARSSSAQPGDLALGALQFEIDAGYNGYALPIANAALARRWTAPRVESEAQTWAAASPMAYQLAYDYSAIPVHVSILHRQPIAFSGRIEVLSAHGQHSSEHDGGKFAAVAQKFIAPPSVVTQFTLAVRAAPSSRPGQPVKLQVKLFKEGGQQPYLIRDLTVLQLEPAHLYSLVLDPDLAPAQLRRLNPGRLNAGNRLGLKLELDGRKVDPATYESKHYLIGCDRQAVVGQPLAARQFAFVLADYAAVRAWPAAQQQALAIYCLGGGHLLLFNAPRATDWLGMSLEPATPFGRGWILAEPQGLPAAQQRVQSWLEGELAEFVLLAGGSAGDFALNTGFYNSFRKSGMLLDAVFAVPEVAPGTIPEPLSHRAGYLHPVWINRWAAMQSSLEPWDYPEFKDYPGNLLANNANLRFAAANREAEDLPASLGSLVAGARILPPWWSWLSAVVVGAWLLLAGGADSRLRTYGSLGLAGLLLGGAVVALRNVPQAVARPAFVLSLLDVDARSPLAAERRVTASLGRPQSERALELPAGSLIRRADWLSEWGWRAESGALGSGGAQPADRWHGLSASAFVSVRSDNAARLEHLPIRLERLRRTAAGLKLEIATPGLAPGQLVLVQTSLGWHALHASAHPIILHLKLGEVPLAPGVARLRAVEALSDQRGIQFGGAGNSQTLEINLLLSQLVTMPGSARTATAAPGGELSRLGWTALLQDPLLGRGMPVGQVVCYCELPQPEPGGTMQRWLRLTCELPAPAGGRP